MDELNDKDVVLYKNAKPTFKCLKQVPYRTYHYPITREIAKLQAKDTDF